MQTRSPALGRPGAGERRRVHCVRWAKKAKVVLASAFGGGHKEAQPAPAQLRALPMLGRSRAPTRLKGAG
eukprot:2671434-Pleurochrysis_carterae.AAC.2